MTTRQLVKELREQLARCESYRYLLREQLAVVRKLLAEARADRDSWKDSAQKSRPHLEMPDEVFDEYVRADY